MIFRKLLYVLPLTGLALFLTLPPLVSAQAVTYYVSSTSGNDANDGLSETTPWQTIAKVNAVTLTDNAIVLFKRGELFRGAISALKSPKGLTFGAYSTGDNPIIAGSVPITGWKPTTNSALNPKVYEADVATLPLTQNGIEQLFVNSELMTIARYPNVDSPAKKNWLKVGASAGTNAFTDPALVTYAKPNDYWKGATLRFRTSWTYAILPITAYNATTGKITATGLGSQLPEWGYFIDGKLEELEAEGEWYYDANAKKVYFYPKGGADPNTLLTEGTTSNTGISISSQEHNTTVENLTFRHFTGKGISIIAADNIIVKNCRFEHNVIGIALWNTANTQVTSNTFDHQLKESVSLSAQADFSVQQTIIQNNQITNTAMYPAYGVRSDGVYQGLGISVFGKAYTVRQNTIDWSSHSGMYLKDGGHHLIENNVVRHSLALLNDGGAIAISSDGNTIRGNFLLESIGNVDESNGCASLNATPCNHHSSYGMGIGADNNFKDNVIEGNTIANNLSTGIRLNAYINTTVRNNVLYNNATQLSVEDTHGPSSNNVVDGNIFYSLTPDQMGVYLTKATNHGSLDNNSYCNPYSEVTFFRDSKRYSLASWQVAFPTYDKNSKQCGVHLPEYSVSNVGTNLFLNSTFTNDVVNWVGSGAVTISHDSTQTKLDGGSLKAVYKGTGNGNVMSGNSNIFSLTANQSYHLKFSVVGNGLGNIHLRINDVSQTVSQLLMERYFAYDTNRKDYELVFQSPVAITAGKILFITTAVDADTYWLDNVTWEPVTAVLNDAKQSSPLFSNTTGNPQTVSLGKKYFDLADQEVTGSLTLPAFSSKMLITYDNTPVSPTPQTAMLTVAKAGNGTVTSSAGQGKGVNCGTTCTETYTSGSVVTLTATPDTGSTFTGWTGTGCAGTLTMTANLSCTATFTLATTPTVALTLNTAGTGKGKVSSSPTGIDCGAQCTANYPTGSSVTLTATPTTGAVFTGWTGNCAGTTTPLTVTMDTTKTCTATFNLPPTPPPATPGNNALTITKVGNGTVTSQPAGIACGATCSANYPVATVVTLTATPEAGSKLVGFSGDVGCTSGQVTLNTSINCVVTFETTALLISPPPVLLPPVPICPTSGTINEYCRGDGKTMTVNIGPLGHLSDAVLEGTIPNEGWLSNITVKLGATVKGGVVTGYITNQGTMSDIDFVGAKLKGGTLSGNITNSSKIGGTLVDVTLAPNAHLSGGRLQGTIKGDVKAPALLENLRVLAGSHLSGVTLGKNVTQEKGVTVDGTQPPTSTTPPPTSTTSPSLPDLGEAVATDAKGNSVTTSAKFTGGVAINGATTFQATQEEVKNFQDTVDIRGNITVDPAYMGQKVDIVLYTSYQATPADKPLYFMLDTKRGINPWDEKLASLVAFQQEVTLTVEQPVEMWQGVLPIATGILHIHFGYRLPDGTVVENTKTIDVTVK